MRRCVAVNVPVVCRFYRASSPVGMACSDQRSSWPRTRRAEPNACLEYYKPHGMPTVTMLLWCQVAVAEPVFVGSEEAGVVDVPVLGDGDLSGADAEGGGVDLEEP